MDRWRSGSARHAASVGFQRSIVPLLRSIGLDDGPLLWLQQAEGWIAGTRPRPSRSRSVDERSCRRRASPVRPWPATDNRCRSGHVWPDSVVMVRRPSRLNWPWRWNANPVCLGGARRWMACVADRRLDQRLQQWQRLQDGGQIPLAQLLDWPITQSDHLMVSWRPWRLVQALAGRSLLPAVQGLAIAGGADQEDQPVQDGRVSSLRLRARLQLG